MILVDSSVWVDYFRGAPTPSAQTLDALLDTEKLVVGDLILTEVLQGFRTDADFKAARKALSAFTVIEICGRDIAVQAAQNFRKLRALGVTVRKTIDTLIATRCIEDGLHLLHADRDFEPFERHLGLKVVQNRSLP
ncbi:MULTISPECIES: PIN domain nuclease [unclassified Rhizobacter]|uniref:type II toxin-antitoxin system VapC family toxin n=1 Tax=unclassified Rhizobacter TaxID=2640088 RepID=UPI0006F2DC18|nr:MULTISPECIES: PIN domain nuclease [unclassified Rhizobacter]KQU80302.1 twitching motility protein PilT [Rhizobacter sp. Root29]KQW13799.1 twitching motility protein PilT [Rhizobacter sp. Root1238]KRB20331.1 twitching motility protein PilT [Rhizobacter sp. Root16D2]